MNDKFKAAVTGGAAGIINGFIGSGGGMLLVPLFTSWLKLDSKKAFATSLAVTLPLSLVSGAVYLITGSFDFQTALPYLIGGLAGGFIAGKLFKKVPPKLLRRLLGAVIIYGGVRCLL